MAVEDLRQSPMMGHMLEALENGEDISHNGRLAFAMIGRHFLDNDELVGLLTQDHDANEQEIKALVQQVQEKGYSPPRREKILEYQAQQDFPICPNPDDATRTRSCNFRTRDTSRSRSTGRRRRREASGLSFARGWRLMTENHAREVMGEAAAGASLEAGRGRDPDGE